MNAQHALLIISVIALSACASKVRLDDLPPVTDRATSAIEQGTVVRGTSSGTAGTAGTGAANNTNAGASTNPGLGISGSSTVATVDASSNNKPQPDAGMLAKRSIYFDYDSFTIRDDAKAILQAHARNLSNNRNTKVALEGHTDERGGGEYNLALGQKRANAVQEALQLLGVAANQMEAVSFGKEKPKAQGSDEAGYAENRRADIQYK
jgi:peptidoglycan-associated lipoprotein